MKAVLALAVVLGLLTACGKKGPPDPPGPADQITFPKSYPTR
jgi:predicted small lipoprotein YifL